MEGIINVVGAMPRIGTTTIALQLVHFLVFAGYNAVYVEMNEQDYIWGIKQTYRDFSEDHNTSKVTCQGIELFPKECLSALVEGGSSYDYLIVDYGNVQSKSFDAKDFQKCGAMLLIAGYKPNEVFFTELALQLPVLQEAITVFSFCRHEDKEEITSNMKKKAGQTVFAPFMPDPLMPHNHADVEACFFQIMNLVVAQMQGGGI